MQTTDNQERLHRVVAAVLDVSPSEVGDDTSPETQPAWDSLSHLDLVVALEAEFGVSLSAEESMEMASVHLMRMILQDHGIPFDGR